MTKSRAYGLTRMSKLDQANSLAVQEQLIDKYAAKLDAKYLGCIEEPGVSAYVVPFLDREHVRVVSRYLRPGDHVIIWKLDRLVRRPVDVHHMLDWLKKHGAHLHILNYGGGEVDTTTAVGKAMLEILASVGGLESGIRSERLREHAAYRKDNGMPWHGNSKWGYKRLRVPRRGSGGATYAQWLWDHREWQLFYEIYKSRKRGETIKSIANDFYRRKVKTADGLKWNSHPDRGIRIAGAVKFFEHALASGEVEVIDETVVPGPKQCQIAQEKFTHSEVSDTEGDATLTTPL